MIPVGEDDPRGITAITQDAAGEWSVSVLSSSPASARYL